MRIYFSMRRHDGTLAKPYATSFNENGFLFGEWTRLLPFIACVQATAEKIKNKNEENFSTLHSICWTTSDASAIHCINFVAFASRGMASHSVRLTYGNSLYGHWQCSARARTNTRRAHTNALTPDRCRTRNIRDTHVSCINHEWFDLIPGIPEIVFRVGKDTDAGCEICEIPYSLNERNWAERANGKLVHAVHVVTWLLSMRQNSSFFRTNIFHLRCSY